MADARDNSLASSWAAELGLSSYNDQPITQTQQDSSSSWFPSQPYNPSYSASASYYPHNTSSSSCYPHNTADSSTYATNPMTQQQYNDEFLNLSLSCGDWSGSSHQSKGKEPISYSYNNQKPVNDEPYFSPYTSSSTEYRHDIGSSSYTTNLFPHQQENDGFLNLSLSSGDWSGYSHQKPVYDGFGAASLTNQALGHVSTQLSLGRDSWTTMQAERKDWTNLSLSSPTWSIRKKLESSDTNSDSTLSLPKESMRDLLKLWDTDTLNRTKGGMEVAVWDGDTRSEHQLILKQRRAGNYDRYALKGGWRKDFVKRRGLKKGDEIGLYWDPNKSRFDFCVFA